MSLLYRDITVLKFRIIVWAEQKSIMRVATAWHGMNGAIKKYEHIWVVLVSPYQFVLLLIILMESFGEPISVAYKKLRHIDNFVDTKTSINDARKFGSYCNY